MALDVAAGDEVLVPTFTFFATAGAVARLGARPIFVDIEPGSFNISAGNVRRVLERHPRAKAAIPVDLFGEIPDWDEITAAMPAGTALIEDSAQAILAEYKGRRAGSLGSMGCFSFFPAKNLGGYGDGGMLVTNDDGLADRLRRLRVHGGRERYFHDEVGFNSRLDTIQAAVLLVKLRRLAPWTSAREQAAAHYSKLFIDAGLACAGVLYPSREHPIVVPHVQPGAARRHVFHQYTIRTLRRDELHAALDAAGIGTAIYYPLPLHLQRCFANLGGKTGDFPEAERATSEVLSLPIFPEITEDQQDRVVTAVRTFFR